MRPGRAAAAVLVAAAVAGCRRAPEGPQRLLVEKTVEGRLARSASLSAAGETRPALVEPAAWTVALPRRALLTFAAGVVWSGAGEPPGWFRLAVRADGQTLAERTLNPRALRDWRDLSLPLDGLGGRARLEFDLRLTDREGRPLTAPPELTLAVADPTVHDLDGFGRAPGVVLVSIDTLRRDHVGIHGYARPTTPRLDALARAGVVCQDAVSTSSWTLPAHLSLLTSVDPGAHGGVDMKHGFNRRLPTLPDVLRKAGYATQAVTSHLYVSQTYGLDAGFDHLDFHQDRRADDVADRALGLLDRLGDRPFFVFLHFYDPHWHYDPPAEARKLFERPYAGTITGLWQDFSRRDRAKTSAADLQHLLDLYDGEIRYTDDALGRVLDHLRARGLDRSTLVVVTSDHGEEFLEHGSWEHQKTLYEEVVRIPLVFAGPRVAARSERAQVSLLDVMPTVLEWAGVAAPAGMQGRSLLQPGPERDGYGETDHTPDGTRKLFLRGGADRWKAIFALRRADGSLLREEWYDLASDPAETKSAAPALAVADSIRQRALARWRDARRLGTGAPAVSLSPEQRERLRALGYVGP